MDSDKSEELIREFLESIHVEEESILKVLEIVSQVSFSKGNKPTTIEAEIVQDADRLDAIGKPLLYRVTDEFLDAFQLEDLKELPELPQTRNNSEELFEGE